MQFIISLIYCRLLCFPLSLTTLPPHLRTSPLSLSLSTFSVPFFNIEHSPFASEFHGMNLNRFGI